jgi:hypothetical protein
LWLDLAVAFRWPRVPRRLDRWCGVGVGLVCAAGPGWTGGAADAIKAGSELSRRERLAGRTRQASDR